MSGWGGRWGSQPGSLDARFKRHESEQRFARVEAVMEARREAEMASVYDDHDPAPMIGFTFAATGKKGLDSGRRRWRVICDHCGEAVHEATTGPRQLAESHIRHCRNLPALSLPEQPAPSNPPRGEPVWPRVIERAAANNWDGRLIALMRGRDAFGRAKYGVPLCDGDGRNTAQDALEEVLDLIVYLQKLDDEGEKNGDRPFLGDALLDRLELLAYTLMLRAGLEDVR